MTLLAEIFLTHGQTWRSRLEVGHSRGRIPSSRCSPYHFMSSFFERVIRTALNGWEVGQSGSSVPHGATYCTAHVQIVVGGEKTYICGGATHSAVWDDVHNMITAY